MRVNGRVFSGFRVSRLLLLIAAAVSLSSCVSGVPKQEVASVYFNLGNAYIASENYKKAAEAYQLALSYNPRLSGAGYNLARAYMLSGRNAQARETIESLLEDDPENILVLESYAWILVKEGKPKEALGIYADLLALAPLYKPALFNSSVINFRETNYEQVISLTETLLQEDPSDTDTLRLRADSLYELEKKEESFEYYKKVHDGQTEYDREVVLRLAWISILNKDFREAVDFLTETGEQKLDSEGKFLKATVLLYAFEETDEGLVLLRDSISSGSVRREFVEYLAEKAKADLFPEAEQVAALLEESGLLVDENGVGDAAAADDQLLPPAEDSQ